MPSHLCWALINRNPKNRKSHWFCLALDPKAEPIYQRQWDPLLDPLGIGPQLSAESAREANGMQISSLSRMGLETNSCNIPFVEL
jgi:hypothetical protein